MAFVETMPTTRVLSLRQGLFDSQLVELIVQYCFAYAVVSFTRGRK